MKDILYTKYNSTRKPEYRVSTSIIEENGQKYVVKKAMQQEAKPHLAVIVENGEKLAKLYSNIEIIENEYKLDFVVFPFVKGKSLLNGINFEDDAIEEIVEKLKAILFRVNSYNPEYVSEFEMTESFAKLFTGCEPQQEKATLVSNIDGILGNFVETEDGKIWCIDYEWVLDFPVPIRYVIYRSLLYLYVENGVALSGKITLKDFLAKFEFQPEDVQLFHNMEECFQQYVHGTNREYIYLDNYQKEITRFAVMQDAMVRMPSLEEELRLTKNHADNLQTMNDNLFDKLAEQDIYIEDLDKTTREQSEVLVLQGSTIDALSATVQEQQAYIEKMKRAIKNPFYAIYWLGQKLYKKLNKKQNSDVIEEEKESIESEAITDEKTLAYREKYKALIGQKERCYEEWITALEANDICDDTFSYNPKISILVPVYNVLDKHLIPCIESVLNQVYDNWELCLADDNSTWDNVKETLSKYEHHEKIKVVYRIENGHISKCTNSALEVATGEYVAFMDCDDVLRPNALYEIVKKLNEDSSLDFIYSDEDKIDDDGNNRHMPHFKPDWSPDTLMSHMYTCHFGVYRRSLVNEIGGLRSGVEGAQDYDFTLRFTEKTNKIAHIDKILYHWREREESTAINPGAKPYILEAAKKAKADALERRGLKGELELVDIMYQYRVNYISQTNPLVSIIIPSKDNFSILARCVRTLNELTEYKNYEVILVDNGSNDENRSRYEELCKEFNINYIYEYMSFNFSKMCNIGAKAAKGEYYLFLNDDIEIIDGKWLTRMIGHAELNHVGAVGAKLLYPNGQNIQHIGVLEIENGPVHAFSGFDDSNIYYFGRNRIDYNWLAVTAACLLVNAKKYEEVKGFNEDLAVAYNDVDFCFKLIEAGYYNVVRNDVVLYHHESISRGNDLVDEAKLQRLMNEQKKLYAMHPRFDKKDPFYSSKLTQHKVDFDYNFTTQVELKDVIEYHDKVQVSKKVRCSVDILNETENIYIEGWAFIKDREDNNDATVNILLKGSNTSYVIETDRVYRPDVAEHFAEEKYLEFVGYKCEFERTQMVADEYQIGVIVNDYLRMTESTISI